MTNRRTFIAGTAALAAAPALTSVFAQEKPAPRYRIGVLDTLAEPANAANMDRLRKGLQELGYLEGTNLHIEYRSAEGDPRRLPALAAELARLKVDLFVTNGTPAALAAKNAPGALPVVTAVALDPVDTGLVASLEKPGANVTGIAVLTGELEKKRVELLWALAPGRKRIAVLVNMSNPALASTWSPLEAAAKAAGMQAELIDVRKPGEAPRAVEAAAAKRAEALVVRTGALPEAERRAVIELAAKHKLPAIYAQRQFVEAGGLVSYGIHAPYQFSRVAKFVDRIVKGAKPAELPMERPTRFELVINRKTLRALGLVIPPDLLLRSDEIVG